MACFIAPTAAAIVTAAVKKKIPARYRPDWLLTMLLGASAALIVDHIASGELVLYPPFLTGGYEKIVPEIFTRGILMTVVVFAIWVLMVVFSGKSAKTALSAK